MTVEVLDDVVARYWTVADRRLTISASPVLPNYRGREANDAIELLRAARDNLRKVGAQFAYLHDEKRNLWALMQQPESPDRHLLNLYVRLVALGLADPPRSISTPVLKMGQRWVNADPPGRMLEARLWFHPSWQRLSSKGQDRLAELCNEAFQFQVGIVDVGSLKVDSVRWRVDIFVLAAIISLCADTSQAAQNVEWLVRQVWYVANEHQRAMLEPWTADVEIRSEKIGPSLEEAVKSIRPALLKEMNRQGRVPHRFGRD